MTDPLAVEGHFAFGENWKSFVNVVDANRIARAEAGMRRLFPDGDLRGARFLDVGCGSGLSSLAAARSGAAQVHGVDIDPASVEAARSLLGRHLPPGAWSARIASVFDLDPARDGLFDVVYSWGVLHHTGAMWRAVESAAALVRPGGLLAVALYRKTALCEFWRREKALYARAGRRPGGPPGALQGPLRRCDGCLAAQSPTRDPLTTHQFLSDRAESARRVAFRGLDVGWTWGDAWRVGSRRSRRRSRRTCAGVCPGSTESSARAWPC